MGWHSVVINKSEINASISNKIGLINNGNVLIMILL